MKKIIVLCLFIILGLSACTASNGYYSALSNKPMNLYDVARGGRRVASNVETDSSRSIFVVIPTQKMPSIEEAVSKMLAKYNGDYIENAEVTHTSFHIMWAYHYSSWKIKGNVVKY